MDPFLEYQKIITNSLIEMHQNNLIDKETMDSLKPLDTKSARFYLLPKIHKNNNPGRPVVSSVNCHTTKISKYVDHYIQTLAIQVKSYITGTIDLLSKIKHIKQLPQNTIFVTLDVRSLNSNFKHDEGLAALKL